MLRLVPNNFTPASRTPWGGTRIRALKAGLHGTAGTTVVGESWEVSVSSEFPSRTVTGGTLAEVIAADPTRWLGRHADMRLLVKLLDARDDLSVQVHPANDATTLGPDESGKPESWWVLGAAPGAGIYLGFQDGVTRADVQRAIADEASVASLMNFVPVQRGDYFVIPARTAHAIGAGVFLAEPQAVFPGRRGVTYRLWDWNRRYDATGRRDPHGEPRPLHVDAALETIDWSLSGDALVASARRPAGVPTGPLHVATRVDGPDFRVVTVEGTGEHVLADDGRLWAMTCVAGSGIVTSSGQGIDVRAGESLVFPAQRQEVTIEGDRIGLLLASPHV